MNLLVGGDSSGAGRSAESRERDRQAGLEGSNDLRAGGAPEQRFELSVRTDAGFANSAAGPTMLALSTGSLDPVRDIRSTGVVVTDGSLRSGDETDDGDGRPAAPLAFTGSGPLESPMQVVSVALSAGTVWSVLHFGAIVWLLVTASPVSRGFDPLAIIQRGGDMGEDDLLDFEGEDPLEESAHDG